MSISLAIAPAYYSKENLKKISKKVYDDEMAEQHWYKEAIIYEVHVKSFFDNSDNGIGDFKGLTKKLDYLQDLGITAIWVLPFYPSPMRDDGYDIADYTKVHPSFGNLSDFRNFLSEAHRRGIRVITELVLNHTSDQHPWFQKARLAKKNSSARNFYVWSDTTDKYKDARIIFQDFEVSNWSWDPIVKSYYWHRFYHHQPDLNFENPAVHRAIFRLISFWLEMGVDGLRLDAVPYLYEREGTNCENLPETHAFLKKLRQYVDRNYPDRMLLAEANQWPEDAAEYFGDGDECHMAFHFPVMPRLFMSIILEDSLPIVEIMGQTPPIPEVCQWALFLRNHDELTLEMVTDEERDYMFRVYAYNPKARLNLGIRRRLAPLLKNDRRKIELMNSLLFSLTGTPVLYYGDEIGMGDNIYLGDRNGVRTPMQWSSDKNAGFSRANPQQLFLPPIIDPEYHYETINVEAQQGNPYSLLWWTKQLINLRKSYKAFSYGTTEFLGVDNRKVLVFFREYNEELIMIVANLSRFAGYVELNLSKYKGYGLIEMFAGQKFPKIGELPYFLTLGPYGYYWFLLEKQPKESLLELFDKEREKQFQEITIRGKGENVFEAKHRRLLENTIRSYLFRRIWFKSLGSVFDRVRIVEHFVLSGEENKLNVFFMEITLKNGTNRITPLYLLYCKGREAERLLNAHPENVVIKLKRKEGEESAILFDASMDPIVFDISMEIINKKKRIKTERGEIKGILIPRSYEPPAHLLIGSEAQEIYREESFIIFPSDRGVLRLFWQIDEGMNVDVEIRLFLTKKTTFRQFLPILGYIEYKGIEKTAIALAEEVGAYRKEFNAKTLFTETVARFFTKMEEKVAIVKEESFFQKATWMELIQKEIPRTLVEVMGEDFEIAQNLAKTTANMHLALASRPDDPEFSLIPFTLFYQRSLYQNIKRKVSDAYSSLHKIKPDTLSEQIKEFFLLEKKIQSFIQVLPNIKINAMRMRYHGNYFLENLHYTGKEFIIANFEGNFYASYHEKKYKRSPLIDIVTMYLSFAESSYDAMQKVLQGTRPQDNVVQNVAKWAAIWSTSMGIVFLRTYLQNTVDAVFLPKKAEEIDFLLGLNLIKKCAERIIQGKAEVAVRTLLHWFPIYENFKFRQ